MLMASGQNSWCGAAHALASLAIAVVVETVLGYAGCDRIRTQPFWVMGHDAQPVSALSTSQARALW